MQPRSRMGHRYMQPRRCRFCKRMAAAETQSRRVKYPAAPVASAIVWGVGSDRRRECGDC
jgi:hypothetical protein